MSSSTSPSNVLQLAKQGHPVAIATLINHVLRPHGVVVEGGIKDGYLQLLLKAEDVPDQKRFVPFLYQGLVKLQPGAITMVKIYGQCVNHKHVVWSQELHLPVTDEVAYRSGCAARVQSSPLTQPSAALARSTLRRTTHQPLLNRKRRIVRQRALRRFLSSMAAGALATAAGVPLLMAMIHLIEKL